MTETSKNPREIWCLSNFNVTSQMPDGQVQDIRIAIKELKNSIINGEVTKLIPLSAYQSLQADIEYLKRMLADERSGDSDKDKTIRRLESNYQSLLEQCEKIEKALEFYTPSKDAIFEVVDEGRNYDTYNVIYESDLSPDGKCDQPLGTKARQALEEYRKSKGDL